MVPDEGDCPALRNRRRTGAKPLLVNVFFLVVPFAISACATLLPTDREPDFSVVGRIGAVAGTAGASGDFLWRQYPSGFDVQFWGPLGQGRTHVVVEGDTLSVLTARGERVVDSKARDWIRRELYLDLPVRALASWINGHPAPEWPAGDLGEDAFRQLGWRIEIAAWDEWNGRRQPRKLVVSRDEYRVTIVCREWTFSVR